MSLPVHPLAGQRVGYARISGASQNLDGQTDALNAAGCQKIFADTASGKLTERPELTLCMGYLRAGDTLVVWRLDRLGRSLRHLVETVNALAERGVAFASLHYVGDPCQVDHCLFRWRRAAVAAVVPRSSPISAQVSSWSRASWTAAGAAGPGR